MFKPSLSHRLSCRLNSLLGGNPKFTICGRLYRRAHTHDILSGKNVVAVVAVYLLDLILSPRTRTHCLNSLLYSSANIEDYHGLYEWGLAKAGAATWERYMRADFRSRKERRFAEVAALINIVAGRPNFCMHAHSRLQWTDTFK